jgi:hypothetical protein
MHGRAAVVAGDIDDLEDALAQLRSVASELR